MQQVDEKPSSQPKVSLRDRAIMLVIAMVAAAVILRPVAAFESFSRGNFFINNGFTDKAISQYERAVFLDPGLSESYGWLGFAYKKQKQVDKAIEVYQKGLKVNPNDKQVHFELGLIYLDRKDFERAISHFDRAAKLDPSDPASKDLLAVAYAKSGKVEDAKAIWKAILEHNPDYKPAKRNLERY